MRYAPLFAHLYSFRPRDIDELTVEEFRRYREWADDWQEEQRRIANQVT